ncbi:MAG: taurine dioxygenase [Pseudomonadales bacterium]|nr:taurine dioxygenase [Pseudomonadales bacterium]
MKVRKAAGALGAYVSDVDLFDIVSSNNLFGEIRALAVEHEVLFFRDQEVEPAVYQDFARSFGDVLGHPAYAIVPGTSDVQVLESTPENPSKIEVWHSDMTFGNEPPSFTLLHGQIIPEFGGDTMWASATSAYENLSPQLQTFFSSLTAVHDFRHGFKESLAESGGRERLADAIAANPPVEHPVVRTHPETGKKSLYVNALFTTHIKELEKLESEQMLQFLYQHIVSEEHTVRLSWEPYTVAIWDNRSTQHKPVNDFFPQHRKMHRVTICGDRPA